MNLRAGTFWIWVLRVGLALAFIVAGVIKALDPGKFLISVRTFELVGDPWAAVIALVLPWVEILAGVALFFRSWRVSGLLVINLSLVMFMFALVWVAVMGIDIECGCYGGEGPSDWRVLMVRDLVMLAVGLFLLAHDFKRSLGAGIGAFDTKEAKG